MQLEGIHHITAITGNAPANVEFYVGVLGLRLVKKSVNQDVPNIYHLFYADEKGSPGSDITFFEYPGMARGRAGAGMVHRIVWRVASEDSLAFWEKRLGSFDTVVERHDGLIRFKDPEGLELELRIVETSDPVLIADHPEIPADLALQGFDGARAYTDDPDRSRSLLEETLGFRSSGTGAYEVRGDRRGSFYEYDASATRGEQGAGTVHHIAWAAPPEEHADWRDRVVEGGASVTPIIDRFYFKSIYFREPSGVLFEIASIGPGFTVDEPVEQLGEKLSLPPDYEHLRAEVEPLLTPLPDIRRWRPQRAAS
ncbi:MAG TPA: VOC family protein [Actinomycetota bacterium]|jgi:glyoxalase family protein|nr:VOC family protein [Actinomycetota bacterium]